MAKLCDICEVYSGYALKEFNDSNCGVPVIKIGNILMDGTLSLDNCQYTDENVNEKYHSKQDDIYIALSGATTGKIGQLKTNNNYIINQRVGIVRTKEKSVPSDFIKYYLQNITTQILQDAAGCAQPNISPKQIGNYEIPVLEIDDMCQIAANLDKVTHTIDLCNNILEKLDLLVKARFVEMFGDPVTNPHKWEKVNISTVVGGKVSNGFFAKRDEYCDNGNVKVLGVANIVNRMYSNTEELPQTNGSNADIEKYGVKYGDMLFCRSSLVATGIGKASIVPKKVPNNVLFECHVIRLPLNLTKCVPEFMQVLSTTDYFRNQVISQSKTATMTTIGQDGILKSEIILPPLELQKQFLMFVEQTDKSKSAVKQVLEKAETLKKALMQEYFG